MDIAFRSILKDEFASFMEFAKLDLHEKTLRAYRRTLSDFDSFLFMEGLLEKKLDADQIKRWLDSFKVHRYPGAVFLVVEISCRTKSAKRGRPSTACFFKPDPRTYDNLMFGSNSEEICSKS